MQVTDTKPCEWCGEPEDGNHSLCPMFEGRYVDAETVQRVIRNVVDELTLFEDRDGDVHHWRTPVGNIAADLASELFGVDGADDEAHEFIDSALGFAS